MSAQAYGHLADPSRIFCVLGVLSILPMMWFATRPSRTPTVDRGEAVAVGVRDGRRGPCAPTRPTRARPSHSR